MANVFELYDVEVSGEAGLHPLRLLDEQDYLTGHDGRLFILQTGGIPSTRLPPGRLEKPGTCSLPLDWDDHKAREARAAVEDDFH